MASQPAPNTVLQMEEERIQVLSKNKEGTI